MKTGRVCCSSGIFSGWFCRQSAKPRRTRPGGVALPGTEILKFGQMLCTSSVAACAAPAPSGRKPTLSVSLRSPAPPKGELFASADLRRQSSPLRGSWQSRQALTERVGSLPEGAGAAQAASEGANACQHNIYPNLSTPAPGKTAPPGQGNGDSVDCRQN